MLDVIGRKGKVMKKYAIIAIISLSLCLLAGCGGNDKNNNDTNNMVDQSTENGVGNNPNSDSIGNDANNAVDNVIDGVGNGVNDVVDGITNGVEDVTDGITNGVDDMTNGVDHVGDVPNDNMNTTVDENVNSVTNGTNTTKNR